MFFLIYLFFHASERQQKHLTSSSSKSFHLSQRKCFGFLWTLVRQCKVLYLIVKKHGPVAEYNTAYT